MLLSEQLRAEDADLNRILYENQELIERLYTEALAESFTQEEDQDESFAIICVIIAACMLNNLTEVPHPFTIEYDADEEDVISVIGEAIGYFLTFEAMCRQGKATKEILDGAPVYTMTKIKKAKKATRSGSSKRKN